MSEKVDFEANGNQDLFEMVTSGTAKQLNAALAVLDPLTCKDKEGNSLLHRAVSDGTRPSAVKLIIDVMGQVDVRNSNGETPLGLAAAVGNEKIVALLLAAGAKPDAQDKQGRTALIRAADVGHAGIVGLLLKHGANVDATDRHRETALMIASTWGYHKVVQVLVRGGATCDFPNGQGWTALMFATDLGHAEVVKILQKHSNGAPGVSLANSPTQPLEAVQAA
jgi:ankyrin repeat protein